MEPRLLAGPAAAAGPEEFADHAARLGALPRGAAASASIPVFIRVSRMSVPEVYPEDYAFVPGRAVTLHDGDDVTLISNGTVLWRTLVAAERLADEGISARVISMPTVKPLDTEAVLRAARETQGIVTAEEATVAGALGGAVAETVVQNHPTKVKILSPSSHQPARPASCLIATACPQKASPRQLGS